MQDYQNDPRAAKLQAAIDRGRQNVTATLEEIQREFQIRRDRQVRPSALQFRYDPRSGLNLQIKDDPQTYKTTPHSEGQIFDRVGLPRQYAQKLAQLERVDLIDMNLRELQPQTIPEGALVRTVGETAKGFLSPSFKMMDAAPVLSEFLSAAVGVGFSPFRGLNTDYRFEIVMVSPHVLRPTPNEYIVTGVRFSTGDYGNAAESIAMTILRISCMNLAQGMELLRRVHLGARNRYDDETFEYSTTTRKIGQIHEISKIRDVVKSAADNAKALETAVAQAANREISDDQLKAQYEAMKKRGVRKETVEAIKAAYDTTPAVSELLPEGKSAWRLSNAISLIAQSEKLTKDQRIDLEQEAFNVLNVKKIDTTGQQVIDI